MAKKQSRKNRKQVKRQTRHFQLRAEHPQDQHVAEILNYYRAQRKEVTVIRNAVELFYALEHGNLEALFDKFPQYKPQLTSGGGNGGGGHNDLAREIAAQIVLMGGTGGYMMQSALPAPQKLVDAPKGAAAPVAVVVQAEAATGDEIADAFVGGLLGLF